MAHQQHLAVALARQRAAIVDQAYERLAQQVGRRSWTS
jgi:hypothetical protein